MYILTVRINCKKFLREIAMEVFLAAGVQTQHTSDLSQLVPSSPDCLNSCNVILLFARVYA